ncbi:MAG: asparagine synthase-related protein [Candidatus Pacearchaeota archaeon]|jgi:asparagine synthase (glutamine-hydrolysing)
MCSINYLQNGTEAREKKTLELLAHRGPDSQAYVGVGDDLIGATRLAIVDVANGNQPMQTEDGRYVIVFNGEVFNHKGLRGNLEARGRKFNTNCDTEVVLNAVAEYGSEAPKQFEGQFAYVVKDRETGVVYAARDHFGIRPLYFGKGDKGFVVASEIPALLTNGVSGERIRKLPQGCTLEYSVDGKITLRRYYDVRDHISSERTNPERLYSLLEDAVRKQVPEEVDHAVILSGIDSSTMAYIAYQQGKKPRKAYTVATSPDSDDVRCARELSRQLGIEGEAGYIDKEFVKTNLRQVVRSMATPLYFPLINAFPTLKLAHMVKGDGIKVVMTGSGSDETNLGYDYLWELFDPRYIEGNALILLQSIGEHECLREDRILASQGIEGRVPFLDRRLVEYVLSTPFDERLVRECGSYELKSQLKKAMRGKLPDLIVNRKKENLYRSTGVIPLICRVAEELMTDREYDMYMDSLKSSGWEPWIMGGKTGALFHKIWTEEFPELAKVPLKELTCGFQVIPPFENLDELSRYWSIAGGGINLRGWNGGIR